MKFQPKLEILNFRTKLTENGISNLKKKLKNENYNRVLHNSNYSSFQILASTNRY